MSIHIHTEEIDFGIDSWERQVVNLQLNVVQKTDA